MILEDIAIKYNTDKQIKNGHGYTIFYEDYFKEIRDNKLNLLEIGVREGNSLLMWLEYFPNSLIWGIDNNSEGLCPEFFYDNRIKFFKGNQDDEIFLNYIIKESEGFDIIIDDASHISPLTIKSFNMLYPSLQSNGLYIIEDLHVSSIKTPYCPYGPDSLSFFRTLNNSKIYNEKICFIRKTVCL